MPTLTQQTERLQRISRRMRFLILALLGISPFLFAFIAYWKGLPYMLRLPPSAVDMAALSVPELAVVIAVGALRPAAVWLALWPLLGLFTLFERGMIFEAANLKRLRQFGWALIAVDAADMAQRFLTGPVLYWFGAGEPRLAVAVVFSMAIVGLFILVIAQVMDIGRELQEADRLTI